MEKPQETRKHHGSVYELNNVYEKLYSNIMGYVHRQTSQQRNILPN